MTQNAKDATYLYDANGSTLSVVRPGGNDTCGYDQRNYMTTATVGGATVQ